MNISFKNKEKFFVAGISKECNDSFLCALVWEELFSKFSNEEFAKMGFTQSIGVCYGSGNIGSINYLAGFVASDVSKAKKNNLDILEIDSSDYIVVELCGKVPECIHRGWQRVTEFFEKEGYSHANAPSFEYYFDGDLYSDDYKMELWVPVSKV